MKQLFFYFILLLACHTAIAQNNFTGIAKYKITVKGNNNPATDSMCIIFNRQKVKVILYLPDINRPGYVLEKSFIDDFATRKSISLKDEDKTYTTETLKTIAKYTFINTRKITAVDNVLCFQYKADSTNFDTTKISGANCLGSIDHTNSFITDYFFLGIQPVIIDNRIVMDFVVTKPGDIKERIYIYDIKKLEDVESYFNLAGYTPE